MDENVISDIGKSVSHMKKNGVLRIIIISLIFGVLLLLLGGFFTDRDKKDDTVSDESNRALDEKYFEYKSLIEGEVEEICMSVKGVRGANAIVIFDSSFENSYAENTQSGNSGSEKSEYVVIGSGSSAHALYLGEKLPQVCGIGVVCDTGDNESARNEILCLISSAYGLPMTRVYVAEKDGN